MWLYDPLGETPDNLIQVDQIGYVIGIILRYNFCSRIWIWPRQPNSYDNDGIFIVAVAIAFAQNSAVDELKHIDCIHIRTHYGYD